ncbi:MAG TPA: dihydropteroate synthase [Thermoanaerobaculia bacterium]
MSVPDLVFPASSPAELREIYGWDAARTGTFAPGDFPVDVVRFGGSSSPPVAFARGRRAETLKALPASLRERVERAFSLFDRPTPSLSLPGGRRLDLTTRPAVMGVVNVTPDSFSDGGLYADPARATERALELLEQGADLVDIGGESTRPAGYGPAQEVPAAEEISRVVPVIEAVRAKSDSPISVDTRKASVAREALGAGADIVNDVSGLRYDRELASTAAAAGAAVILMHMRGLDPRTMQNDVAYDHPVADIARELAQATDRAREAGIGPESIAVDPGLGFGKSPEGNLILLRHLAALRSLGLPVAVGASRKAFVRRFSGVGDDASASDRLPGSLAGVAAAVAAGASIVRVHDVEETVRFLRMLRAIAAPAPAPARAVETVR